MTVLYLPLISFIKHDMNISLSRVAMNKPTGYGMRRQVGEQKGLTLWSQTTPRQEEGRVPCCQVSCMFTFVST